MQTILGAGGVIATELAKSLREYTDQIQLVSRNPKPVHPDDRLKSADLTQLEAAREAVKGAEVAYLTVGLPYRTKVWESLWPKIMENVIAACKQEGCRLVFLDNVYMYDPEFLDNMNETTPVRPVSRKGKVRAQIAEMLLREVRAGNLNALIARSADFYGPGTQNRSLLTEMVFQRFSQGKAASWFVSADYRHSFTYTPEAGKALARLGNTPEAFNQVWHLPTAPEPPTGKEWIEAIASEMQVKPEFRVISRFMLKLLGKFVPIIGETVEMLYQYDRDYVFHSRKFEENFNWKPIPYLEGIQETVRIEYR